jgi:hypothetical protein
MLLCKAIVRQHAIKQGIEHASQHINTSSPPQDLTEAYLGDIGPTPASSSLGYPKAIIQVGAMVVSKCKHAWSGILISCDNCWPHPMTCWLASLLAPSCFPSLVHTCCDIASQHICICIQQARPLKLH